jgi:hypothetical protein
MLPLERKRALLLLAQRYLATPSASAGAERFMNASYQCEKEDGARLAGGSRSGSASEWSNAVQRRGRQCAGFAVWRMRSIAIGDLARARGQP